MANSLSPAQVLLCDANFSALPIFLRLKKSSLSVATCGKLASDPCHAYADKSFYIDYSNYDELLELVKKEGIKRIIPGCNDRSYMACAWVADSIGLEGFDSYEKTLDLMHKDRFRSFALSRGYPVPKAVFSPEEAKELTYPLLVKPVDSFSGRGVQRIETEEELLPAWQEAASFSSGGRVVIEEFVEGGLFSHSAFVRNGTLVIDFFVDEYCTVYPYQVNSSCVSVCLSERIKFEIRECISQLVVDMDLTDGLLHTQFISNEDKFWLIELTRRCPGDLYSLLIEKSTGINYADLYVGGFTGMHLPVIPKAVLSNPIIRHTVSALDEGVFHSIAWKGLVNAEVQVIQLKKVGEYLRSAPFDKAAIMFARLQEGSNLAEDAPKFKDFVSLDFFAR